MPNKLPDRAALAIAGWFGCGYVPFAPGTVGAAAALAVVWALERWFGMPASGAGVLAALLLFPGMWAAGRAAVLAGRKDPSTVVVDEVLGQWIAVTGAVTLNWKSWLLAFALFRLFDIWKPFPVRQLERLPGGAGIIADDLMAGVYGALVLLLMGWSNLY